MWTVLWNLLKYISLCIIVWIGAKVRVPPCWLRILILLLTKVLLMFRWRTKQNLDYTYSMMYARSRGTYYVQVLIVSVLNISLWSATCICLEHLYVVVFMVYCCQVILLLRSSKLCYILHCSEIASIFCQLKLCLQLWFASNAGFLRMQFWLIDH